ncbi:RANBP2 [Mytilus coruscus]|uniref:RanBP-type and C3HC4-type zinc finger-containing protein 1 n=1 Tax=Mytilus coruscus TaxID=42192 RepID=A0A6J8CXE1_MYTCO|nr:RANBP2 [Mytilus coruscus]
MAECVDSQKIIDILICPICLERYTKPKYLPCLHTFCEGCILTYIVSVFKKSERKDNIECPVCRTTVKIPKEGCTPREWVDQFPGNFLIVCLLEKEKPQKLCMSCERLDIVSQAIFICIDCLDTLCDICQKYHNSNKATSNHDIKKISALSEKEKIPKTFQNICSDHSKKLKLFCNDHKVPCCTLCVSLSHRKCDNVVTFEEAVKTFSTDVKLEKIKTDIRDVSNDFDNLISHYVECLQSNDRQYEIEHMMIEETCDYIISKVKATEKIKKDELTKMHDEKQHILENRLDTCQVLTTVVSDKLTEISNEKGSEIQILIRAYNIEDHIKEYKQLLKTYREDEYKLLIHVEKVLPTDIDMFMNSLYKLTWGSDVELPKLLTPKSSPGFNPEHDISFSQTIKDFGSGGFKFGLTTTDQKSSGFSSQFEATIPSAADVKLDQTTKADKTTISTGNGAATTKGPFSGGFRFGKLSESVKNKPTQGQTVSSISDKNTEHPMQDQLRTDHSKLTSCGLTFQQSNKQSGTEQTGKPYSFSFGGDVKSGTSKPALSFTCNPMTLIASASLSPTITTKNIPVTFKPSTRLGLSTDFSKPLSAQKDKDNGFWDQFQKTKRSWICNVCLISNIGNLLKCRACGQFKHRVTSTKEKAKAVDQTNKKKEKTQFGFFMQPIETSWKCNGCLVTFSAGVSKCPNCGILRLDQKDDLQNVTERSSAFGSSNGGFTFAGKVGFTFGTDWKYDSNASSGYKFPTSDSDSEASSGYAIFTPNFTRTTITLKEGLDSHFPHQNSGFIFPTPDSRKNTSDSEADSGITFPTPDFTKNKSNFEAASGFRFPTPDSTEDNSISQPFLEKSRRGLSFTLSPSEDDSTGPKYLPIEPDVGKDAETSKFKTSSFGQGRSSDLPKPKYDFSQLGPTIGSSSLEMKEEVFNLVATGFSFSSIANKFLTTLGGIFGEGRIFSFSDLAKEADSSTSAGFKIQDHNEQFRWKGAGQILFSTDSGDGYEEDADESGANYDPHYKPIIALPDLVDVKTGEEDYEKMFCQRAKLYRFHKETNQWKEIGLGEMKILRHRVNSRYRLILRRQIVLKLACNQWLTPDISFQRLPTSETSWCWVGQDFSDNKPVIEQLVIKFKTIDLAQQFKLVIDSCQNDMRERNSASKGKGDVDLIPTTVVTQSKESRTEETQSEESRTVVKQPANSRTVVTQPEESKAVVKQPDESRKDFTEEEVKVEEEEEDDNEYSTDDDSEEIVFEKRIKFFSKDVGWKVVGQGTVKVIYDEDVNGYLIKVELDNKNVVCNHLVAKEQNISLNYKDCLWSPIDFSTDEPVRRHFKAKFNSQQAAQEFQKVFEEGRQLAQESDISERDMATFQT